MQIKDVTSFLGITKKTPEPVPSSRDEIKDVDPRSYGEKLIEYSWTAPSRVVKEIPPKTIRTLMVIAISVSLLFALMQEFLLIVVIASIGFLAYMLTKIPAVEVRHELSTHGLLYAGEQFYYWHELKQFFFKEGDGVAVTCIDTVESLPGRLFVNIDPADKEKIKEILSKRLVYLEEEPKTFADKIDGSAVSKFSLDK